MLDLRYCFCAIVLIINTTSLDVICKATQATPLTGTTDETSYLYSQGLFTAQPVYFKPNNLITNAAQDKAALQHPMLYHFVTEYRPTELGHNYYIKPGGVVASINVESKPILIRSETKKQTNEKNNIIFVPYPALKEIQKGLK